MALPYATAIERLSARRSLAACGVLLVLVSASAALRPSACGELAVGYAPLIAFELARTQPDLDAIFGSEPSSCREALVSLLDGANVLDLSIFMPAYGVFLLCWFASFRTLAPRLVRAGMVLTLLALLADVLEDACLLALTPALDARTVWMSILPFATGAKWIALGAAALAEAGILVHGGPLSKLGAALALVTPLGCIGAVVSPSAVGFLVAGAVTVAWVVCLATAVGRARTPRADHV